MLESSSLSHFYFIIFFSVLARLHLLGGSRELRRTMDFQRLIGLKVQVLPHLWFVFETEACKFTVSNIPT